MGDQTLAFWVREPGCGQIQSESLVAPGPDEVLVRTLHSGISRGTESLVFTGRVPASQQQRMRAPFQQGDFPGPVKYGYLNVGVVEQGPPDLLGQRVFCLYPHQAAFVVPSRAVTVLPDAVPSDRAVLTGAVETAINALWDARPLIGDRVTVVGAGMIGCAVARLAVGIPGVEVELVDTDTSRAEIAAALGVDFATPSDARLDRDLVFHTSATSAGLQLCLELLADEASVVEMSWYGDADVTVGLGAAFHSRRLSVKASQVGRVSPAMAGRRTTAQRLQLAVNLLRDPAFDVLLSGHSAFADLPSTMRDITTSDLPAICHVIDYPEESPCSA